MTEKETLCPIDKTPCAKDRCAWWCRWLDCNDEPIERCTMKALPEILNDIEENLNRR